MMSRLVRDKRTGFTLIEMLIVIVVIAILALIVIPRLMGAARRSKEASLRADLKQLRDAIERFEGSCAAWPPALSDIMAANGTAISADADGRGISVDRAGYDGPYLVTSGGQLPKDPFTGASDWTYNSSTGEVHSSSTLAGLDGTTYSTW
jgi:prepilin-type N-terminal cleavage/methylation domain-containing protein